MHTFDVESWKSYLAFLVQYESRSRLIIQFHEIIGKREQL